MAKMVSLNTMLPADFDDVGEMHIMVDALAELNQLACQPVILTGYRRGNSYYGNGSLISNDLYHQTWYFPNGQLFMAKPGEDTTIYYPNGRIMAYHWMHGDQALFWPNGAMATTISGHSMRPGTTRMAILLPMSLAMLAADGSTHSSA